MTTIVMISSPDNNHEDILVQIVALPNQDLIAEVGIHEGEKQQFFVHEGQQLIISEVAKDRG